MRDKIQTIIFDLGNVIIDIDEQRSFDAVKSILGKTTFSEKDKEVIYAFEMGAMTKIDLFEYYKEHAGGPFQYKDLEDAWNAMLLTIPNYRLEMMELLRKKYRVFILSNTNEIHIKWVEENLLKMGKSPIWEGYADRIYYSHKLGMRKPNQDIYDYVIKDGKITPSKSIFFDDKIENTEAARNLGFQVYQVGIREEICDVLKSLNLVPY